MKHSASLLRLLVLGITCHLIGAGDPESDDLIQRASSIAGSTAEERDLIRKNYEKFKILPAEEQQRLRDMDATIRQDPSLNELVGTYTAWLKTLTPGQQEQLRRAGTPTERAALVERYRREQRLEQEDRIPDLSGGRSPGRFWGRPPSLTRDELNRLVFLLRDQIPEQQRPKWSAEPTLEEIVAVLEASLKQTPGGLPNWPSQDTIEVICKAAPPESQRRFEAISSPDGQRLAIVFLMDSSLRNAWDQEFAAVTPTEAEQQKFFANLEPEVREKLINQPQFAFRRELLKLYFAAHPSEDAQRLFALRERFSKVTDLRSRGPMGGNLRLFGGPDDRRGPPPPPPNGNRPPRDR